MRFHVPARPQGGQRAATLLLLLLMALTPSASYAHHAGWGVVTRSAKCGWLEGDNVRDVANVSIFCERSVPVAFRVQGVSANHEYLWIDATADLASALREHDAATETVLKDWLDKWRAITGYRTAFVIVLRGHAEIAKAGTTMRGDFVTIR
jgi:hypothetical protein